MPEQGLYQTHSLRQEQILAPIQMQSLEILMANAMELQERISQELADNPVLEQEKPEEDFGGDKFSLLRGEVAKTADGEELRVASEGEDKEHEFERLVEMAESWNEDYGSGGGSSSGGGDDDDEKRKHFFDSIVDEPSIQEQLLEQLRLSELPPRMAKLAETVIGSVDDQGYLRSHLADLATICEASVAELEDALATVQDFEPPGVAARDLRECLLIQLERRGRGNSLAAKVVAKHLEDAGRNHLPQIAKALKVSIDELNEAMDDIKGLNPYPCSALSTEKPVYVLPEIVVEKIDGEYVVTNRDDHVHHLRISRRYLEMLEDPSTPRETKDYIKEKLLSGKNLIRSIEQRQDTLRHIAEVIVDTQFEFLEDGLDFLKPLTMRQVADKIGVHETTVSRAISNKYIQVPGGLYDFKFFFTTGYQSSGGDLVSNRGVMEKIRDIVADEDSAKPLSDDDIAAMLKEGGLPVARRTVAKYREELGIPSSRLRKEF